MLARSITSNTIARTRFNVIHSTSLYLTATKRITAVSLKAMNMERNHPLAQSMSPSSPYSTSTTLTRDATTAPSSATSPSSSSSSPSSVVAYLAIGGNIGHRARNIHSALDLLQRTPGIQLVSTSFLYETTPVGSPEQYRSQGRFLNGALQVRTTLTPLELLDALQAIENSCGRVRENGVRNGPRTIDLDIIFYESVEFKLQHDRLILPHPRWHQRGFVLAPLKDFIRAPSATDFNHRCGDSTFKTAIETAWSSWCHSQDSQPSADPELIYRVIPFPTAQIRTDSHLPALSDVWRFGPPIRTTQRAVDPHQPICVSHSTPFPLPVASPTHIMGILNLTPDSFSDGGRHIDSIESSITSAKQLWDAGADIIDIGGESTRPGATPLTAKEELQRILPVIQGIRAQYPFIKMSVDTYHPSVARAAVEAGCVMINDVCGGTFREDGETMMEAAAELNVPYVCMHIRGSTQTMTNEKHLQYAHLIKEVRQEQESIFQQAMQTRAPMKSTTSPSSSSSAANASSPSFSPSSVLYRWNLIGDPGIGFAKGGAHAMYLLRHLPRIRPFEAFPILLGTSRKGFIQRTVLEGQRRSNERNDRLLNESPSTSPTTAAAPTATSIPLLDRVWGTSATITASIAGGADIIRVHDVHEMRCVRDVADQIYKGGIE